MDGLQATPSSAFCAAELPVELGCFLLGGGQKHKM